MSAMLKILSKRDIAPQRTISLYQDQEDLISKLNKNHNLDLKISSLIREGVDLILEEIKLEISKSENKSGGGENI